VAAPKLVAALAGVFGSLTALAALLGALVSPVALALAVPFGVTAYVLWYHASGRLATHAATEHRRTRRRVGPRGQTAGTGSGRRGGGRRGSGVETGPSDAEAYRVLGVDPDADAATVRRAYRERAKEVHPDRGGDADEFRRVSEAYERLREDA
jgi:hypothetical protein